MPVHHAQIKYIFPFFVGFALLIGCGKDEPPAARSPGASGAPKESATHDPDDVPITEADVEKPTDYTAAVARIEGYRNTIRDEIGAGRPAKAHRPLDEVDIVLNWLPGIARDSGVPKEEWERVNTTAQSIRELFNKVHTDIDAGKKPNYGAVSNDLDMAIATLKAVEADSGKHDQ